MAIAQFAGLDVSVKETSVCVVDDTDTVLCELKVETEPDEIATLLGLIDGDYARVGIDAGPLSQWLVGALRGWLTYSGCGPYRAPFRS